MSTYKSFDVSSLEIGDIITVAGVDDVIERFIVEHIETHLEGDKKYSISHPYGIVDYSEMNMEKYLRFNAISIKKPFLGLELI